MFGSVMNKLVGQGFSTVLSSAACSSKWGGTHVVQEISDQTSASPASYFSKGSSATVSITKEIHLYYS